MWLTFQDLHEFYAFRIETGEDILTCAEEFSELMRKPFELHSFRVEKARVEGNDPD
jgi:hypothetical protein